MLCCLNIILYKIKLDIFIVDNILLGNINFKKCVIMGNCKYI